MSESPERAKFDLRRWAFLIGVTPIVLILLFPLASGPIKRGQAKSRLTQLTSSLAKYRTEYGSLPSGGNAEIIWALLGKNPRKIVFFEAQPDAFNSRNELTDPWGTPYCFDLANPETPRLWSCGRDRVDNRGAEGSDDVASWR
jgi:hypothetical protein